jgi:hypothetical protein
MCLWGFGHVWFDGLNSSRICIKFGVIKGGCRSGVARRLLTFLCFAKEEVSKRKATASR